MNNLRLFMLAAGLICPLNLAAISLTQSLKPAVIEFDEKAQFEIVLTWEGPPHKYFFPNPLRPQFVRLIGGEVSSSISSTGSGSNEVSRKVYRYTLSPSLSGEGRVESLAIDYILWPDSIPGQLLTEPMTVMIAAPKAKAVTSTGPGLGLWLVYIGLFLIVAGGTLWYLLIYCKRDTSPEQLPLEEQFLAELHAARAEAGDDLKKFQTKLFPALSNYLMARFDLTATGGSTEKLLLSLKGTSLTSDQVDRLSGWLIRAEREKFMPLASTPGDTIRLESEISDFFEKQMMQI